MDPSWDSCTYVLGIFLTVLKAAAFPRFNGNQDVILPQVATCQRDSNHAVFKFTTGERFAVAREPAAARAIVEHARASVLVLEVLALAVFVRAGGVAGLPAAVAARRLVERGDGLAVARVVRLAEEEVAVEVGARARVDLNHLALVELRAADGARLAHPALWVAVSVALVAADGAEHKVHAVVEASALALHDDNRIHERAGLQFEGRARLGVIEGQSDVLAARRDQVARHTEARDLLRRAQAIGALTDFTRLHDGEGAILENETQLISQFPAVVVKLCKTSSHCYVSVMSVTKVGCC